jgi:hypothetical protein
MSDNDGVKPRKRDFIRNKFRRGDGLGSTSSLRLPHRKSPGPNLNNEDGKSSSNTQLSTASPNSASILSGIETGSNIDSSQYELRDIEPSKNNEAPVKNRKDTEAEDPRGHSVDMKVSQSGGKRTPVDMWAMADDKLRDDPKKGEIMQKYDRLLEKKLPAGSNLESIGTDERRKQAFDFFESEIQRLNAIDTTR